MKKERTIKEDLDAGFLVQVGDDKYHFTPLGILYYSIGEMMGTVENEITCKYYQKCMHRKKEGATCMGCLWFKPFDHCTTCIHQGTHFTLDPCRTCIYVGKDVVNDQATNNWEKRFSLKRDNVTVH